MIAHVITEGGRYIHRLDAAYETVQRYIDELRRSFAFADLIGPASNDHYVIVVGRLQDNYTNDRPLRRATDRADQADTDGKTAV